MRMLPSHALGVPIVLHSCLQKVLIDGRQNCYSEIEARIKEHLVRLDLEGTAVTVSLGNSPGQSTYFIALR